MKGKIVRTEEGFEILMVYDQIDMDDPDYVSFGTMRVIVNPSTNETVTPVVKGVAYGWMLAPGCRKVPLIVDNYRSVPASTVNIGFSQREDSAEGFTFTSTEEVYDILKERYNGTLNMQLITNSSNDNYIGPFMTNIVQRLLDGKYTPFSAMRPYNALMLYADDVKTGLTIFHADKGELISESSKPTVSDIITDTDNPGNVYIAKKDLELLRKYLFDETGVDFSNYRKNCILLAATCFCPKSFKWEGTVDAEVGPDGYLI